MVDIKKKKASKIRFKSIRTVLRKKNFMMAASIENVELIIKKTFVIAQ